MKRNVTRFIILSLTFWLMTVSGFAQPGGGGPGGGAPPLPISGIELLLVGGGLLGLRRIYQKYRNN